MPPVLLASTSPYRRALLDRLGLRHEALAPRFDEVAPPGLSPLECARLFARGKARSLRQERPGALIIGADQALECEGHLFRKPHGDDETVEQLLSLAGRWHTLHSAVALVGPGPDDLREEVASVELKMRTLTEAQARRYLALDEPGGSVGGYLFEKRGITLFDEVRGSDDSAIVGLPLWLLCRMLRDAGVDVLAG